MKLIGSTKSKITKDENSENGEWNYNSPKYGSSSSLK